MLCFDKYFRFQTLQIAFQTYIFWVFRLDHFPCASGARKCLGESSKSLRFSPNRLVDLVTSRKHGGKNSSNTPNHLPQQGSVIHVWNKKRHRWPGCGTNPVRRARAALPIVCRNRDGVWKGIGQFCWGCWYSAKNKIMKLSKNKISLQTNILKGFWCLEREYANILTKTTQNRTCWYVRKTKPRKTGEIKNKTEVRHNQHDHQSHLVGELHFKCGNYII